MATDPLLAGRVRQRIIEDDEGCWLWAGARSTKGYGYVRWEGRAVLVHRLVWTLLKGEIPEGVECDHLCREPACCNPDHIELVTHRVNMERGDWQSRAKESCPYGHPMDGVSHRRDRGERPYRYCKTCHRENSRRYRQRVRDENAYARGQRGY